MKSLMVCLELSVPDEMTDKRAVELLNRLLTMGFNEARIEVDHSPRVEDQYYEMVDIHVGQAMLATIAETSK